MFNALVLFVSMPVLLRCPAETVVAIYGLIANENDYFTSPGSGLALTEQAGDSRENSTCMAG
jgi:hypothetical protein